MPGAFLGSWALLAFLLLIVAAAWVICGPHVRTGDEVAVSVAVWSAALVITCTTALSLVRALTAGWLLALAGAVAAAAWGWRRRRGSDPDGGAGRDSPARDDHWWVACAAPIVLFVFAMALAIWSGPETGGDNLAYHLPRLGYWQQQRAVAPFLAGNVRAGSFPPNGNVLQLPPVLFLGHDRFCGLVQLMAAVLTAAAVHGLARGLGATAFGAAMAALCWLAIPCMLEQAGRSLVDVSASFFVAAAAFFLARWRKDAFGPLSALVCVAIAAGVKTHTLALGLPLAAASLWRLGRGHRHLLLRAALVSPLAGLALGGAYHLRCVGVWSDPNGLASVRWVVLCPSLASLRKNAELVGLPMLSLLRPPPGASLPAALWSAATGYGFGVGWLAMGALTGLLLLLSVLRPPRAARAWAALWALAAGGALVLCFTLRHQDAVLRFLLPAAALLTPTFAWTFDRVAGSRARRLAVAALVGLGVGVLLWRWTGNERALRHRDGRTLARSERFGADLQPLAAAVGALDLGPSARWGLLTPDYFPEGIFFGPRYRNRLVPLSYQPPQSLQEIERLDLRALWVDTREACTVVLFRRDFAWPAARPQRNRRARADSYDEDFVQAYGESVYRADLKPTLRALADPSSTWGVWLATPRGALFVKDGGRRADARELCGAP
jgi:hypothetical protein